MFHTTKDKKGRITNTLYMAPLKPQYQSYLLRNNNRQKKPKLQKKKDSEKIIATELISWKKIFSRINI